LKVQRGKCDFLNVRRVFEKMAKLQGLVKFPIKKINEWLLKNSVPKVDLQRTKSKYFNILFFIKKMPPWVNILGSATVYIYLK
jgi:hypothetical protein